MTNQQLTVAFDAAMFDIWQRALKEANYNAPRFLEMLNDHGGFMTAKLLLHSNRIQEGFTALWQRKRLDLTMEAMIHDNSKWHSLFTSEELAECTKRLIDYGYLKKNA